MSQTLSILPLYALLRSEAQNRQPNSLLMLRTYRAGYDIYWVKINKGLELALGYGVECFYGDKLNDLCLEECE